MPNRLEIGEAHRGKGAVGVSSLATQKTPNLKVFPLTTKGHTRQKRALPWQESGSLTSLDAKPFGDWGSTSGGGGGWSPVAGNTLDNPPESLFSLHKRT